jgi:hypothetical protein
MPHTFADVQALLRSSDSWSRLSVLALNLLGGYRDRLGSYGNFWGPDKYGKEYEEAVRGPTEASLLPLEDFSRGMVTTSEGIATTGLLLKKSNVINTELAGPGKA